MQLEYVEVGGIPIGLHKDGPVGVGISGGADSAVLLYILMSNINQPIHIYNMWSNYRKSAFKKSVDSVIETCSRLTGNTNYVVHKMQIEPDESVEFYFEMLTAALDKKEVDIVYLGITNFPPAEVYLEFEQQQQNWHNKFRSDQVEHPVFGLTIEHLNLDDRAYVPFRNYNKKDIARVYRSLDLEHLLLPVTRSCEDDDHRDSHCGKCWWCQERIWAFGSLGE